MATTIRELLVALGVKADNRALKTFDGNVRRVKAGMGTLVTGATLATGVVLGLTGALLQTARATAAAGDDAAKTGKRIGLTAAEVQELSFAAELSDASVTDLEAGMRRLTKTASDAQRGLSTATDAFGDLGINVEDASGELKAPLDLFLETAQAMSEVENDTKRAALAQEVFGRGGARLVPLLVQGRDGIEALRKEARALGFVFDEEGAAAAEKFSDDVVELRKIMEGLRNTVGLAVLPVFSELIEGFRDWFKANRDVIRQRVERVAERLADGLRRLVTVLTRVDRVVRERLGGWEVVLASILALLALLASARVFVGIVTLVQAVGAAFSILGTIGAAGVAQIAGAIALVGAAVGLLFLIVEDLVVFMRGGESAIGAFFDRFERGRDVLPALRELMDQTTTSAERLQAALGRVGMVVGRVLSPVLRALQPVLLAAQAAVAGMIELEIDRQVDRVESWASSLESLALFFDRVTAAIDRFLGKAEGVGGLLSGLLGVRDQVLGERGAAAISAAARAATTGQITGGLGAALPTFAPAGGAAAAGGGNSSVNVEGDNITINGSNLSEGQLRRIFDERDAEKRRQIAQGLRGGDV